MSYLNEKSFQFWALFIFFVMAFLWIFSPILSPFIVGFAVAYLLNPIVAKLEAKKIPRWISALFILGLFFVIIILGLTLAIPVLIKEMIEFVKLLPVAFGTAQDWIVHKFPMIDIPQTFNDVKNIDPALISEKMGTVFAFGKNIIGNIFQSGLAILGFVSFIALMPIVAFYLLVDWQRFGAKVMSLLPKKNAGRIKTIFSEIDASLAGFIRGQLMVCFLLGMFYAIGLSILGVQYGFFVGVAAGVLSIIPYIGSIFGLVASVGLAFYQFGGWEYPLMALGIFVIGQLVEGNYLTPKLVGESIGLHPLWVIFALMAGGVLLGFIGMVIAIPVSAIIAVFLRHAIQDYKSSSYYKGTR